MDRLAAQIRLYLELVALEVFRRYRQWLRPFGNALDWWLGEMFSKTLPPDWRQQFHAFMAEQESKGYLVASHSIVELEEWIEAWARYCRLLPLDRQTDGQWFATAGMPLASDLAGAGRADRSEGRPSAFKLAGFRPRPKPKAATNPTPQPTGGPPPQVRMNAAGLEIAGPGPATTKSFQDKVQFALEQLDSKVAAWWKSPSVMGVVRSRDARFFQFGSYAEIENDRPVIVVDQQFTAGETALAIIREIRGGLFANSPGAAFRLFKTLRGDPPKEFAQWRDRSFRESARYASVLAELYVTSVASISPAGDVVVTVNDTAEHGFSWQQVLLTLPLMTYLWRGIRSLTIKIVGKGSGGSQFTLRGKLFEQLTGLPLAEQEQILKEVATGARTPAEARALVESRVLAYRPPTAVGKGPLKGTVPRTKPPLPPPVAEVRAPIGKGKGQPYQPHVDAAESEGALARQIHEGPEFPNEVVIRWGKPVTAHGPDVISYNLETKRVTFWDDKTRARPTRIKPSETFARSERMEKGIAEAEHAIDGSQLSAEDKLAAFKSLRDRTFQTRTHGSGSARNSTFGDHR